MNKIVIIIFLFLIISCADENTHLVSYFEKIERDMESEIFLKRLKTLPDDSIYLASGVFYGLSKEIIKNLSLEEKPKVIDSLLDNYNRELRIEVLTIAFKKYLNNQKFNLKTIENETKNFQKIRSIKLLQKEELQKRNLKKIVETNDATYKIGDTVNLFLMTDGDDTYRTIFFKDYPLSSDFSFSDDTLNMKGIILEKFYDEYNSNYKTVDSSYLDLIFRLEVLELNIDVNYFAGGRIKIGGEYDLPLALYGQIIK